MCFQGEILKLKFLEKGQYYNQTMIFDEKSVEFDVPRHADIEQTKYFYDYDTVSFWDLFLEKLENLKEWLNNVTSTVVIKGTMIQTGKTEKKSLWML